MSWATGEPVWAKLCGLISGAEPGDTVMLPGLGAHVHLSELGASPTTRLQEAHLATPGSLMWEWVRGSRQRSGDKLSIVIKNAFAEVPLRGHRQTPSLALRP